MPSAFKRTLFMEMPPSIVITEAMPRWKVWAWALLKALLVLLLCALSFYFGTQYRSDSTQEVTFLGTRVLADGVLQTPAPASAQQSAQSAEAQPLVDVLASHSVEGLQVQALRIAREGQSVNYEFEIVNSGRLFEGRYELMVYGSMSDGRPEQQIFPAEGSSETGFRLRVARYLKTGGKFNLRPGLQPQAVVLSLHEEGGVRASRGQTFEESAPPGQ